MWLAIRLILDGHLDPIHAGGAATASIGGPPRFGQQSNTAQSLHRETAPSTPPILALQSAPALSAILIAKQTESALLVPSQNMRAQQPLTVLLDRRYRLLASHRAPDQTIRFIRRLDLGRPCNHLLQDNASAGDLNGLTTKPQVSLASSIFYNTVVLEARAKSSPRNWKACPKNFWAKLSRFLREAIRPRGRVSTCS